ncbi:MAG: oligosaccharyl transferase, archaeosortase A system-associated [Methanotrichaceae archaeon]
MNREKLYDLSAVFATFFGLILRLIPAKNVLVGGNILFYGYDPFYHMRRILYTVNHFPHTLWFDSYLNYPYGMKLGWPPLFDQLIAGTSLLLGADSQHSVELVGALMPPILGSVTILALYFLAKELFGRRIALLSAFMMAIAPEHVGKTSFGFTDHHVMEALFMVGIILFLVLAISIEEKRIWFAVLAGFLMAALAYTWTGAPAYLSFFLFYAAAQITFDIKNGVSSKEIVSALLAAFGIALVLMLPFWNETWIMPSVFAAAGILAYVSLLYVISHIFLEKKIHWAIFPPLVAVLAYVSYVLILILDKVVPSLPSIYPVLRSGLNYFFGGNLSQIIVEAAPLYEAVDLISFCGFSLILALIGIGTLIYHFFHSGIRRGQLLFLAWTLFTLVLSVAQIRFLYLFSANMAILIGFLFFWTTDQIRKRDWLKSDTSLSKIVPVLLLIIFVLPSAVDSLRIVEEKPAIADDWAKSLQWLEENTPVTNSFDEPNQIPEYSIFSWWDYGNWILYQSRRPVVANNFQAGAVDSARFYLSEDEKDTTNILDKRSSRYVITDAKMLYGKLRAITLWIDEDYSSYVQIEEHGDIITYTHLERFMRTTLAGLHLLDCRGMEHFRLIHESNTTVGSVIPVNKVKIFEYVPGARIVGTTQPGQPVGAILNMTSNQGRRFQYFNYGAPQNRSYEITVPYSTEDRYGTHSTDVYHVFSGGVTKKVEVSEEDVLKGGMIEVNF